MLTKESTLSITKLRQDTAGVFKKIKKSSTPLYVFRRSEPAAVLLDLTYYNRLEQSVEDYLDTLELLRVTPKDKRKAVSWRTFKRKLSP